MTVAAAELIGRTSTYTPTTPKWPAWLWIALLVASYAAELACITWAANSQIVPLWHFAMPLVVVDDRGYAMSNGDLISAALLLLAAAQSYALIGLYRAQTPAVALWVGCAAMLALSFAAPTLISSDMYGYVYNDLRGLDSYIPTTTPRAGDFHLIDLWYGGPHGSAYGPLFLALVQVVMAASSNLLGKLLAWRAFCVLLYVSLLFTLRASRLPNRMIAVAALNPGLMLQFVANGHYDIVPIVIVVLAAAWIRRLPIAGFASIVVAAALKIPYLGLAGPITATVRPWYWRIAGLALVVIATLGVYVVWGAHAYDTMRDYAPKTTNLVGTFSTLAAIALLALATLGGRRLRSAVWVIPTLAPIFYSWYFVWGLPYALSRRRILSYFLVAFPLVTMLVESAFLRTWKTFYVLPLIAVAAIVLPNKKLALPKRARRGSFRSRQKQRQKSAS